MFKLARIGIIPEFKNLKKTNLIPIEKFDFVPVSFSSKAVMYFMLDLKTLFTQAIKREIQNLTSN